MYKQDEPYLSCAAQPSDERTGTHTYTKTRERREAKWKEAAKISQLVATCKEAVRTGTRFSHRDERREPRPRLYLFMRTLTL